ncbi:MAG: hypothetical protein Q7V63_00785 [Gammaproteobacteria bacterium]|nr:hypothetical protein [Gammaproteobacteria bacterium]
MNGHPTAVDTRAHAAAGLSDASPMSVHQAKLDISTANLEQLKSALETYTNNLKNLEAKYDELKKRGGTLATPRAYYSDVENHQSFISAVKKQISKRFPEEAATMGLDKYSEPTVITPKVEKKFIAPCDLDEDQLIGQIVKANHEVDEFSKIPREEGRAGYAITQDEDVWKARAYALKNELLKRNESLAIKLKDFLKIKIKSPVADKVISESIKPMRLATTVYGAVTMPTTQEARFKKIEQLKEYNVNIKREMAYLGEGPEASERRGEYQSSVDRNENELKALYEAEAASATPAK